MKCCWIFILIIYIRPDDISRSYFRMEDIWTLKSYTIWYSWSNNKTLTNYFTESSICEINRCCPCTRARLQCCCCTSLYKSNIVLSQTRIASANPNLHRHIPIFDDAPILSLDTEIHWYFLPHFE